MSTPMQLDSPLPTGGAGGINGLAKTMAPTARISDVLGTYRGTKVSKH